MRRLVIPALIAIVASLAASASAQFVPGGTAPRDGRLPGPFVFHNRTPGPGILRDIGDIRDQIDRGRDAGTISKREARQLRRESRMIGVLAGRYGHDGFSDSERKELEVRALYLRDAVNLARTQ